MSEPAIRMDPLVEASVKFTCKLYRVSSWGYVDKKNIFFSPLSISIAMNMLMAGAKGDTLSQMKEVMGLENIDEEEIHSSYQHILSDLADTVSMTNQLFLHSNYKAIPSFVNLLKQKYKADCTSVDFDDYRSDKLINELVSIETSNRINKIIDGPLYCDTVLLLVNTIYFKSTWSTQFDPDDTQIEKFHMNERESIPVKMMFQRETFNLAFDPPTRTTVLELPHSNHKTTMLVFLPDRIDGMKRLESSFKPEFLNRVLKIMEPKETMVWLPSFTLENNCKFMPHLFNLGMTDMFESKHSNFLGITDSRKLFVNEVLHNSFIEVTEDGVEAAAVTCTVKHDGPGDRSSTTFLANRPFLFCIMDKSTQNILFMGKLCKPKAVGAE